MSRQILPALFIMSLIGVLSFMYVLRSKPGSVIYLTDTRVVGSFDSNKLLSDAQWRKKLTSSQYHILREKGTEIPFTGSLLHETRKGVYVSAGCNTPVFRSEQKFDSGTGWPSFRAPFTPESIVLLEDASDGIIRTEVLDICGGHLGHVFDDGPAPTFKRFCINSEALVFIPDN